MRVLIVSDTYAPHVNGAAVFTRNLATGLAARHEVHVVCPSTSRHDVDRFRTEGVVEHRVSSTPVPGHAPYRFCLPLGLGLTAGRILDDVRPDVVHVQSHFPLCRALARAAVARDVPVVATNHFMPENLTHYAPIGARGRRYLHDWAWHDAARVLSRADVVTAPTPYAAQLAESAGIPGPVRAVSCGIDLDRFSPLMSGDGFREKHGLDGRPVIGFVGRLDREKNLEVVIRAFADLRRTHPAQLVLAGTGAEQRRLSALARALRVDADVVLTGFVPDPELPQMYAATDIFVNAGTAELQSLVTLEAMATGRPVVAADAAALPHLVRDDRTGYLFAPGDAAGAADRLRRLLDRPALAQQLGAGARWLAQHHGREQTVETFEQLYRGRVPAATGGPLGLVANG